MAVATELAGRSYTPDVYAVGREKVREFALATGETEPLYLDLDVARAAGHPDLVAPPMFAVVYQGRALAPAYADPELAIDFAHLLHGAQAFVWGGLVHAGDEITTTTTVASVSERTGLMFYVLETVSVDQRGETVVTGTWTNIVRPPEETA